MELTIVSLIIVSGFSFVLWLFLNHIKHLELLAKARDLVDYKHFEIKKAPVLPPDDPEDSVEVFNDKDPQEIRKSFSQ